MSAGLEHRAVLLDEAVQGLNIKPDGVYVDGTFGRGGHARAILAKLGGQGRLLAIDKDPQAIAAAQQIFASDRRFMITQGSFARLHDYMQALALPPLDGVLLDLGMSSPQLDDPLRGFSFTNDGPLDMRMDTTERMSAASWLGTAEEAEICEVLRTYGEERYARRIAAAIARARAEAPLTGTRQLADIIAKANPSWEKNKDPATRSFQAIRIFINHELDDLHQFLAGIEALLAPFGRMAVISFHSLEDRLVKRFIRTQARGDDFPSRLPVTQAELHPTLRAVGKAQRADPAEVAANPRARSAVLRVAERLSIIRDGQ